MKDLTKFQAFIRGCMIGLAANIGFSSAVLASPAASGSGGGDGADPQAITVGPTIEDAQNELFGALFGVASPEAVVEFDVAWADGERSLGVASVPTGEAMDLVLAERHEVELFTSEVVGHLSGDQLAALTAMNPRAEMCVGVASVGNADLWITGYIFTVGEEGAARDGKLVVVQTSDMPGAAEFVQARAEEKNDLDITEPDEPADERQAGGGVRPWGYWRCVGHVLKCEILALGCIAAVPASVVGCAAVCAKTALFGCVACIMFAAGSTVALCGEAWNCIVTGRARGCIP